MTKKKTPQKKGKRDYSKLKISELKGILKEKKLPVSGTKSELIERLMDPDWRPKTRKVKKSGIIYDTIKEIKKASLFDYVFYGLLFLGFSFFMVYQELVSSVNEFAIVFGIMFLVGILAIFLFRIADKAEKSYKSKDRWLDGQNKANEIFKTQVGYNKTRKGEVKNECRECGKTWFYDQEKINTLTESVLAGRHASRTAVSAMGANIVYGQGNSLLNQSVLRSAQLSNITGQTTAAELESLRKCPNCNSNNVKRT